MSYWTEDDFDDEVRRQEDARDSLRTFINMDCTLLAKLRSQVKVEYDLNHMCDICRKYWAISKWFIMTHKSVEHGIPIPHNYKG